MRDLCLTCRRARSVCWCPQVVPFELGFDLALLMHPRETRVSIGTGRMVHRSVSGSRIWVGDRFDDEDRLWQSFEGRTPVVLFPGPGAIDLDRPDAVSQIEHLDLRDKRLAVVAVDGTWTTARGMLRKSPRLDALPKLALRPTVKARYDQIRKEPRLECHSTLESIHALIDRLDAVGLAQAPAGRPHDAMLNLLDNVIDEQLRFVPEAHRENAAKARATRGPRDSGANP